MNKENLLITQTKLTPEYLGKMITFIQDGTISSKQAKKVFECLMSEGKDPEVIIEEKGMKQISNPEELTKIINEVLDANEQSIQDFAAGKDPCCRILGWSNYEKDRRTSESKGHKSNFDSIIKRTNKINILYICCIF